MGRPFLSRERNMQNASRNQLTMKKFRFFTVEKTRAIIHTVVADSEVSAIDVLRTVHRVSKSEITKINGTN